MEYPNIEVTNLNDGRGTLFSITRYAGGGTQTLTRDQVEELLDDPPTEDERKEEEGCTAKTPCFYCLLYAATQNVGA